MTDETSLLERIVSYLKDFRKERTTYYHPLEKGGIMKTDMSKYYIKFDTLYWILAGKETGRFSGAGFALNTKFYNIVNALKTDILYFNQPNYIYYYKFDNYENNSFNHVQSYNGERVRVVSIEDANDVWKV